MLLQSCSHLLLIVIAEYRSVRVTWRRPSEVGNGASNVPVPLLFYQIQVIPDRSLVATISQEPQRASGVTDMQFYIIGGASGGLEFTTYEDDQHECFFGE